MIAYTHWVTSGWILIAVPIAIFLLILCLTFWLRKLTLNYLDNGIFSGRKERYNHALSIIRSSSSIWCVLLSLYVAFYFLDINAEWRAPIGHILWSLLLISITIPFIKVLNRLNAISSQTFHLSDSISHFLNYLTHFVILLAAIIILMDIWGISTSLLFLILIVAALVLILAFPDVFPNFFAGIQLSANQQIKIGDYIRSINGEEGYVTKISWNKTMLQTPTASLLYVPNIHLINQTVVNCGHPLKKARHPFLFYAQDILQEPFGIKAENIKVLAQQIQGIPDEVIYCHTYRCLEENYLHTPETSNDFACWIRDAIGNQELSQTLLDVTNTGLPDLYTMRQRFIAALTRALSNGTIPVNVFPGQEFRFIKASCLIYSTGYMANDLREFVEVLRKIQKESIYCHLFGPKLRFKNGSNDFSIWLMESLEEADLAHEIEGINPFVLSQDDLRSELIKLIEKRIK